MKANNKSPKNAQFFDTSNQGSTEKFGTFHGVFRPTLLTIIGVMLYLREGWLVGNAGLVGAILIILTAFLITGTTALSISSITSNTRVGSGGVFALISQSLGLEIGGAIGVPLYLAQGLSAAMYIHGFTEGWLFLFPEHEPFTGVILVTTFSLALGMVYISTKFAFKVQLLVMTLILAAFTSMYFGVQNIETIHKPEVFGNFSQGSFWDLFAVFFPAATGIMVGASMSGDLKSPKNSIPTGTLGAWGTALAIYILGACYYALVANPSDLQNNTHIGIEKARWPLLVLIGLIASCFTATLSSLAASPRVLQALGQHGIIPRGKWFSEERKGEPRNAMLITGIMVLVATLAGDLNALARLLTMFFLITYFSINLVLVIEQYLNLISFRPQFRIHKIIPIIGSISSLTAIIIISPVLGLSSIAIIIGIYTYLDRKQLDTPWETVHSGLFVSIANWAAKKVSESGFKAPKRSWKPDIMVPIERDTSFEGVFRFLHALCYSQGSIQVVGLSYDETSHQNFKHIKDLTKDMRRQKIFTSNAIMETHRYETGISAAVSLLQGSFFKPNTVFENLAHHTDEELKSLVKVAQKNQIGLLLYCPHDDMGLGRERTINLWVRDQSPDWRLGMELASLDYALLVSHQLKKNWNAEVNLLCVVEEVQHVLMAEDFLNALLDVTRMSDNVSIKVAHDKFMNYLPEAPRADLNIFGISADVNRQAMMSIMETSNSSCLFVLDSGNESAMA